MHAVGALFRQQGQEMTRAGETARDQVTQSGSQLQMQTSDYVKALEAAAAKAHDIASAFESQTDALLQASEHAAAEASRVRAGLLDSRRDTFLRASKFIVEDLNSIGIDISRILDKTEAEKLWRGYAKGDKGAFIRNLIGGGENKTQDVIKARYETDDTFRRFVTRYLEQFESLLNQAKESDPENLLSSTFVTSDIGKLYVLLSRTLGRMA